MTNVLKYMSFALATCVCGAAFAQTAETAETETAGSETTGTETAAPETTEPAAGETYVAGNFSDWELRCLRLEDGRDRCQMYQLLLDSTGQAVAEVNLFAIPPGGPAEAGASVITPLETLLTADLRLVVDDGEARRYPYSFCSTEGCVARLGFTAEEVVEFKRGASGTITIVPALAPDQTVDLTMSLSGFTASYEEMMNRAGLR
ncbi:MAG: invasion associated locus B family protein [Boseongicola sp.]|nr:invasion associated locus B family protein [Boseongicola sp.]